MTGAEERAMRRAREAIGAPEGVVASDEFIARTGVYQRALFGEQFRDLGRELRRAFDTIFRRRR